jgi:hypothetical protein
MPGNPNECRLHALNCMQLAEDATDSELRRIYVDLAHHWNRLHWRMLWRASWASCFEKRAPTAGCRGSRSPQRDKTNWAGARRGTNYVRLITLPSNPFGGSVPKYSVAVYDNKATYRT